MGGHADTMGTRRSAVTIGDIWRRPLPDILGLAWVVIAAIAMLLPSLVHGASISDPAVGDQGDALIPWTMVSWIQVHQGHLPLWNPNSALGMPLVFNWGSAAFGLPALVGYLLPLHLAFATGIIVTLVVAGTGAYVFARLLGLGIVACVFAAVAFELSGPFVELVGWPMSSVMSWSGWLFAAALLVVRGHRRLSATAMFALVLAAAIYAGEPEMLLQLLVALFVFLVILLVHRARRGGLRSLSKPVVDLGLGAVCGAALGAPLALPGLQLTAGSINSDRALIIYERQAVSLHALFDVTRGPYLGVVTVVLACLAVVVHRRRTEVRALAAVAVIAAAIALLPPVISLLNSIPYLGDAHWNRSDISLAFSLAILGGLGVDTLMRGVNKEIARRTAAGFAIAGVVVAGGLASVDASTSAGERGIVWAAIAAILGVGIMLILAAGPRTNWSNEADRGRFKEKSRILAGGAFLIIETVFLVVAGTTVWASGPTSVTPTPAYSEFQRAVGSAVVGFGNSNCFPYSLGILQNDNIVYGVHEFAVYDPMTPRSYFSSWRSITGRPAGIPTSWIFCPAVTSATLARRYGVSIVLEPRGAPGPKGSVFDGDVGAATLYRIPDTAEATLVPLSATDQSPNPNALGSAVPISHPNPATWKMSTSSSSPGVLRLRLTNVPGWHGTIDGKPLPLEPFSGIMLQSRIPEGRHVIVLHYWPDTFSLGIVLAALSALGLAAAFVVGIIWRRRAASSHPDGQGS
jgi:Bacterial membrane protein YfhO